jgi:hypothetical protein
VADPPSLRRRWRPGCRPARGEAGSVALLLPAAVLVVLVLAAIAVDLALQQGGQRRLVDLAGTLATDAVGQIDVDAALATGQAAVDLAAAQRHADRSVAALVATDARLSAARCAVRPEGDGVVVTCTGTVEPVVGRGLPGNAAREVTATDRARPRG